MPSSAHRHRTTAGVVALSAFAITCGTAVAGSSATAADTVLWTPSTSKGPSSFAGVQCAEGKFGVVKDPAKGSVWRAFQAAGEERCETLGPNLKEGSTFYLGWSSKLNIKDSNSRYVFQLKCSPSTDTANHPIEIDATTGRIRLQEWDTKHVAHTLWTAPTSNNQWHSYALKIRLGRTNGTIDFWFDGVKQTFTTGSGTFKGTTWDGDRNYLKWGSYHPSPGNATNTFTSPIMATTLQAATAGS
ncbi:heparin lyase I family protein [Kitasatospora purpeofusca]|uniref:heparin lyase I family protein n=1 Tax=Kitasatospora purpeofusca TaxID=67352 RepID=UPI00225731B5|nr:heparin lyase I family protein [Kitasatospora purpeofusca]MCX4755413.1 polysaccharide lyase [Kitasatospora purpeofusca]WSR36716.1 polysaccharide lyase [Kitasatospora purpeofusca]WSR44998.1 polysaccharide lyase [Kitasatospora purpeofusca]